MAYDKNYDPQNEEIKSQPINQEESINHSIRSSIADDFKEKMKSGNNTKYMKSVDLSSSIHGSDFYTKNLKSKSFFKLIINSI